MTPAVCEPAAGPPAGAERGPDARLAALCWSTAAILLLFFSLAHLGVLLSFLGGWRVSPWLAPGALAAALACGDWLARREGVTGRMRMAPPIAALAITGVSTLLSAVFFDMSWDGLWYHQTAIFQMAHGWNPVYDPLHAFEASLQDYVQYYAKGPWYIALSLFETTGHIEWAKPAPWIAMAASFLGVVAAGLDLGLRRRTAVLVSALVALNPVIVCELASYLVDGLLSCFLACYIAAIARWVERPSPVIHCVAATSTILCINTKFSAIVYLCFFCGAGALYLLLRQRRRLLRFAVIQAVCIALAVGAFGFNPYVTNTVYRGHPFYPWMGTAAHPSYSQRGQDPNDRYETPHNMLGRNRFVRFYYGLFGRPGAQPFVHGPDAHLMLPFAVSWRDFRMFYFHEVRIAGFGPLFSGAFLMGLVVLSAALTRPGVPRLTVTLLAGAVILSPLVGLHMWWARYGPQVWWLPVIAVAAGLAAPGWRGLRWASWGLATLLLVNAVLVGMVHFRWEFYTTRVTNQQLALLRQKGEVEVNLQYFIEPFSERLRSAGVSFRPSRTLHCGHPMELMSVDPGYPGQIRACIP